MVSGRVPSLSDLRLTPRPVPRHSRRLASQRSCKQQAHESVLRTARYDFAGEGGESRDVRRRASAYDADPGAIWSQFGVYAPLESLHEADRIPRGDSRSRWLPRKAHRAEHRRSRDDTLRACREDAGAHFGTAQESGSLHARQVRG